MLGRHWGSQSRCLIWLLCYGRIGVWFASCFSCICSVVVLLFPSMPRLSRDHSSLERGVSWERPLQSSSGSPLYRESSTLLLNMTYLAWIPSPLHEGFPPGKLGPWPQATSLCGTETWGLCADPSLSTLLPLGPAQRVLNNNSPDPSMKKETHCVYRYRIWHLKHESTFGLGAPGQGCWTPAPLLWVLRPTCFLCWKPGLRGGQVDLSQLFIPRPSPVSLRGSDPERSTVRKCSAFPAAPREEIAPHSNPQKSILLNPHGQTDLPSWYAGMLGRSGLGVVPLYFSPCLWLEPGFDSWSFCCCCCCWVVAFFKKKN